MSAPPPPPAGTPPPPPALGAAPATPPPPPFRSQSAAPAIAFGRQLDPEQKKREQKERRLATLSLAAKPEIIAIAIVAFVLWVSTVSGEFLAVLLGVAVFGAFSWIYMTGGDSVIASLQLGAIGLMAAVFVGDNLQADPDSLLWIMPGLIVIACEAGATYNNYRRRRGEISLRIPRIAAQNLVAILACSILLGATARALTQVGGRVEWPWFATTAAVLSLGFIAAMMLIRRSSTPADTRRFNPGRRMLPPPKT